MELGGGGERRLWKRRKNRRCIHHFGDTDYWNSKNEDIKKIKNLANKNKYLKAIVKIKSQTWLMRNFDLMSNFINYS